MILVHGLKQLMDCHYCALQTAMTGLATGEHGLFSVLSSRISHWILTIFLWGLITLLLITLIYGCIRHCWILNFLQCLGCLCQCCWRCLCWNKDQTSTVRYSTRRRRGDRIYSIDQIYPMVYDVDAYKQPMLWTTIKGHIPLLTLIDTGASVSIIDQKTLYDTNGHITNTNLDIPVSLTGHDLQILGQTIITASYGGICDTLPFLVMKRSPHPFIIGMDNMYRLA